MAKRRTIESIIIAIDIGYGHIKLISSDGRVIVMPSAWGNWKPIHWGESEMTAAFPGEQLQDENGRKYYVGELALMQLRPEEQFRLRSRNGKEDRIRLFHAAMSKALGSDYNGEHIYVAVSTGLPVDHMTGAQELKNALLGQHRILTDITDTVITVTDVLVMPQPFGTLYSQMLTPDGHVNKKFAYRRVGIVDIGTYTVDAAVCEDRQFVSGRSGSNESGVHLIEDRFSSAFEAKHNQKPDHRTVQEAICNRIINERGKRVNYDKLIAEGAQTVLDGVIMLMNNLWKGAINIDRILLTGGGAEIPEVYNGVVAQYEQTVKVENAQLANAQGYLNYALLMHNGR